MTIHSYLQRYILLLLSLVTTVGLGCQKFVEVSPPASQLEAGAIFANDEGATAAMMGIYSRAMLYPGYFLYGGNTLFPGLSADEYAGTTASPLLDAFATNSLGSDNPDISLLYASAYNGVYNVNVLLQNLSASVGITPLTNHQIRGEACFLRALIYFYLVDLFGPVPLETGTDYSANSHTPRASVSAVYEQISSDLLAADSLLGETYAVNPANPGVRTRPNKWAARALLARLYLYQENWAAAEVAASTVLGVVDYLLEPSLDSVFLAGSREAIWQLQPVSLMANAAEGYFFLPADGPLMKPAFVLDSVLRESFEAGDRRRQYWVGDKRVDGVDYPYPDKYSVRTGTYPYTEYEMVLRKAEQFLIRAEARAEQGNSTGALADLDTIRARAGLGPLPTDLKGPEILLAVRQERRIELMGEWGHRWSDLRRWGWADSVLAGEKSGWQPNAKLYPLPLTELQRNPALWQNPGY